MVADQAFRVDETRYVGLNDGSKLIQLQVSGPAGAHPVDLALKRADGSRISLEADNSLTIDLAGIGFLEIRVGEEIDGMCELQMSLNGQPIVIAVV